MVFLWVSYGFPVVSIVLPPRKGRSPGMLAMAYQLVQSHGPRRLLSGAGATFTGYFLHGAFKYGSLTKNGTGKKNWKIIHDWEWSIYIYLYICIYTCN